MPPPDAKLGQALRDVVEDTFKRNDHDALTVKRIRTAAEEKLGLEQGFFKSSSRWNATSKEIIAGEVTKQEEAHGGRNEGGDETTSKDARPQVDIKEARSTKRGVKRLSDEMDVEGKPPGRKRQKKVAPNEREAEAEKAASDVKKAESEAKPGRKHQRVVDTDESEAERSALPSFAAATAERAHEASDSELSVVLDEVPPQKGRRKKSASSAAPRKCSKGSKQSTTKGNKAKADTDADADLAEIKRLQGWLVKCGVRKLWGRELRGFDGAKAKSRHLRGLLKEVGMDGRYSEDKARRIREERELAADLEAVQEGNKNWGKSEAESESESEGEDEDGGGKPRRRLARGLRELDFLGEGSGEESSGGAFA